MLEEEVIICNSDPYISEWEAGYLEAINDVIYRIKHPVNILRHE